MSLPLTIAAVVVVVVTLALVGFQLALAAGAPWGVAAYGGQHRGVLPTGLRIASAVAAPVWTGVGLVLLRRAGVGLWAPLPDAWLPVAVWVVAGLLVVSVVLNTITRSAVERAVALPAAVLLLAATVVIALAP